MKRRKQDDDRPFDSQYVADVETKAASLTEETHDLPDIQTEQYGVAKPRRVVIRGKIIRDD